MKTFYFIAVLLLGAASAWAQAQISPSARFMLHRAMNSPSRSEAQATVLAIVDLDRNAAASADLLPGTEIVAERGTLALVRFPIDKTEELAALPQVRSISFGKEAMPLMNEARKASYVEPVLQGTGFDRTYRGEGVILGMMDSGLDPNHINFYNQDLSANRITWMATIYGTSGRMTEYKTPSEILSFSTENPQSTHATHVAGIMGGGYNRTATVATSATLTGLDTRRVPFYGVAPYAEMNLCAGDLYEENITLAAENVAQRAKAAGKPCVFNLSVGSVIGPHDGTDAYNRYMSELGKEMIICIAAGNDGNSPVSLQNEFATTPQIKTVLTRSDITWNGVVEVWNSDATAFDISLEFVNSATGAVAWSVRIPANKVLYISNSSDNTQGATHNTVFDKAFSSSSNVYATTETNAVNNRYMAQLQFDLTPLSGSSLVPVLAISGTAGKMNAYSQSVEGLGFGNSLTGNAPAAGYTAGNPSQSINNLAMADNIICVGAYLDRLVYPSLDGNAYKYSGYDDADVGHVAAFTSYGTSPSGRSLPDFCAPGMGVISSYSQYCAAKESELSARATTTENAPVGTTSRTNTWGIEAGTSMATPYVAGSVALLLEADPTLNVDRVRTLLSETSMKRTGRTEAEQTQWGAGAVNIQDAMLKLIGKPSAINGVNADTARRLSVTRYPGSVAAKVAGSSVVAARLYSVAGALAASAHTSGDEATLSTAGLPGGVYVLKVEAADGTSESRSIIIE